MAYMKCMLVTVVETPAYLSKAERIMTSGELSAVVDMISAAPLSGDVIRGSGGLRKMRVGLQGRGKRGGGRVIYWFYNEEFPAVLLWAFAKNEVSDLTRQQLALLAKAADGLLEDFRRTK